MGLVLVEIDVPLQTENEYHLDSIRAKYYDSKEKYQYILNVKKRVDTDKIFSANTFCIGEFGFCCRITSKNNLALESIPGCLFHFAKIQEKTKSFFFTWTPQKGIV